MIEGRGGAVGREVVGQAEVGVIQVVGVDGFEDLARRRMERRHGGDCAVDITRTQIVSTLKELGGSL